MKGLFVVLDGVSDESCYRLKDKTPLEYAKTPNLDFFASKSKIYNCFPIAEGIAPQSSSGLISLFGFDFRDYPRGVLEAIGAGIKLNEGDLVLRCNFSTIENLNTMKIIDRRVGRTLTNSEAIQLAQDINSKIKLPYKFELIPTLGHRAVLVFRGVFSSNITNVDPYYESGLSVESASDIVEFSKSNDDGNKSKLSADLLNSFIKKSYVLLENHPINILRKKKGFFPANFILCRDAGTKSLDFKKLNGSWMGFGYTPLEIGIIKSLNMKLSSFKVESMNDHDFYEHAESTLRTAIGKSIKMIEDNLDSIDYFYIHFKETDLPGHDNKPMQKVKFIEMIDELFFKYLKEIKGDFRMLVTSDHTTSCRVKSHTSDPVPALFFDSKNIRTEDHRFIEMDSRKEISLNGRQILSKTLFSK